MKLLKYDEMKKSWLELAKYTDEEMDSDFKLELYRKLQNIFHVGEFYYFIVNFATLEVEWICTDVEKILGLKDKKDFTMKYLFDNIHPDDKKRFVSYERQAIAFFNSLEPSKVLNYKLSYDYRVQQMDGKYIWILMQCVPIQSNEDGALIRVLDIHTDITHLKTDNQPSGLSFLGLNGEPSFINVPAEELFLNPSKDLFTPREKEIIKLIVEGNKSPQIAEFLSISVHTVNTHRKNIMHKSKCSNWIEFSSKIVASGWL
ncbi:LuxR C-terminal-related transcriptional regulator [Flavobacterium sp. 7A]|uniref:LuxR C-terminal-related transcriptional regulator n=1 Tax=Flavobacterium sp. 7A TaxID=2940571 RepID=UPI002227DC97|nr:LuxR C-terminal-related transcriptional regulator [Flavobacterium sp. 7A]MCW2120496.1 DNA-binding CsgD family transcriptional regulator [Flavobacterium sp. 7A]